MSDDDDLFDEPEELAEGGDVSNALAAEPESPGSHASIDASPVPQPGVFQGLAATIPEGGTTLLAIAKLADGSLLVSVQPARTKDEDASTALPLQVKGSPAEIDQGVLDALAHYVPARRFVVATAEETARATAAAATARAAEAKKKTPSTTTRPAGARADKKADLVSLTIECTPSQAKLTVADASGKQISATSGIPLQFESGAYTIYASAAQFESHTETVELRSPRTVTIKLVESTPSFAF